MSGRQFLEHLTEGLSRYLDGAYVLVGRLSGDGCRVHAEPTARYGQLLPGCIDYDLAGTPCAHVVDARLQYFDGNVVEHFPHDDFLVRGRYVSYLGCPMFDSRGRPSGLLSVLSGQRLGLSDAELALFESIALRAGADMERADAVVAREASETLIRQIVDHQTEMVCRFRRDGQVTFANRAYLDTFGIELEDLASFDYETVLHPDDRERVHAALAEIGPDRPRVVIDNRVFTADGRMLWTEWTNIGLGDQSGTVVEYQSTGRDVTAARVAEQRLREAHELKDRFLAMLAHELRNPLGAISNALAVLELAQRRGQSNPGAIAIAKRQTKQQARLLDDLLDLSRITRGKVRLDCCALPLFQLVGEVADAKRPVFSAQSQALSVELPTQDVLVHADRVRLEQIVANLLDNASKYTPEHGRVRIEGRVESGSATLRIVDSGRGVPPHMKEAIFDMFQQVSAEGTLGSGLGIGLTVVRELVTMHGGTISVESPGEGQGSTFSVRLPILGEAIPRATPPGDEVTRAAGARRRIMVVDDNEDAADMLADLLRAWGHEVTQAYDGEAALRLASPEPPELVLMDIAMPGLDGYATAARMREMHPGPSPRIVALTGFGQPSDVRRALEAHFELHLTKPVDHAVLREIIG